MYLTIWLLVAAVFFGCFTIIRFFIKFNRRKQKILKYVSHLSSPKEYPIVGSGLRFFGKSSEGEICAQKISQLIFVKLFSIKDCFDFFKASNVFLVLFYSNFLLQKWWKKQLNSWNKWKHRFIPGLLEHWLWLLIILMMLTQF